MRSLYDPVRVYRGRHIAGLSRMPCLREGERGRGEDIRGQRCLEWNMVGEEEVRPPWQALVFQNLFNTREKSPIFRSESEPVDFSRSSPLREQSSRGPEIRRISGKHVKPRLLSRGINPKGLVIFIKLPKEVFFFLILFVGRENIYQHQVFFPEGYFVHS